MKEKLYYLQNTQGGYCGNSIMWWAYKNNGYTVDVRCAKVWTHGEFLEKNQHMRECDIFWDKDIIDPLIQHHIDFQDLDHKDNNGEFRKHSHVISTYRPDLINDSHTSSGS